MMVLPAVNPVLQQLDSSFSCQRAGIQAPTSLQKYDDDVSSVCSSRSKHRDSYEIVGANIRNL